MTKKQSLLIFLDYVGKGLLAPVLSLVLIAHGCTLATVGVATSIYSATIVVLELPSGVMSDLFGRKRIYYLSCLCMVLFCAVAIAANSFPVLIIATALQGAGRAFSSGTIDAAILDYAVENNGEDGLTGVTSSLSVWQSAGIAVGALLGGVLPDYRGYILHLLLRGVLAVITAVLTHFILPREEPRGRDAGVSLRGHISDGAELLKGSPILRHIFICGAGHAFVMFSIEIYWQNALLALPVPGTQLMLGVLMTLGFGATILGSWSMGKLAISDDRRRWRQFFVLLTLRAVLLIVLSLQRGKWGYGAVYIVHYLILGAFVVPEQTLINAQIPAQLRASMLSLYSLVVQIGGMLCGFLASSLLLHRDISFVWQSCAAVSLLVTMVVFVKRRRHKQSPPAA